MASPRIMLLVLVGYCLHGSKAFVPPHLMQLTARPSKTNAALHCSATASVASSADEEISQLMLRYDPLLHWARRLLSPSRAAAASALYAWCRRLDQIVDEPGAEAKATLTKLNDWEARLNELMAGTPRDAMDGALLETLNAHPSLGRAPFEGMLAGMRDDVDEQGLRYQQFRPELLTYCCEFFGIRTLAQPAAAC